MRIRVHPSRVEPDKYDLPPVCAHEGGVTHHNNPFNGVAFVNGYDDASRLLSLRHEGGDGSLLAEYLNDTGGA